MAALRMRFCLQCYCPTDCIAIGNSDFYVRLTFIVYVMLVLVLLVFVRIMTADYMVSSNLCCMM